MKKIFAVIIAGIGLLSAVACTNDKDVASQNLSQDADNFKIARHISFINTRLDTRVMEIQGLCAIEAGTSSASIAVVCKDDGGYKKNIVALSQDITYVVEQLDSANVSAKHFLLVIKPASLIPNVEVR